MSALSTKIEEVVWTLGSRPRLDKAIRRSSYEPNGERRLWAAYLPGTPPTMIFCTRYLGRDSAFSDFTSYLREVRPRRLLDYLYVVDTYRQSRIVGEPFPEREETRYSPDVVVEDILSASFGYLLWQFQLERLAQAIGLPRQGAIKLRRAVNKKQPSALNPVRGHTFASGQSLQEVIEQCLVYDGALAGQWGAARILRQAASS